MLADQRRSQGDEGNDDHSTGSTLLTAGNAPFDDAQDRHGTRQDFDHEPSTLLRLGNATPRKKARRQTRAGLNTTVRHRSRQAGTTSTTYEDRRRDSHRKDAKGAKNMRTMGRFALSVEVGSGVVWFEVGHICYPTNSSRKQSKKANCKGSQRGPTIL
jgi:hypothetical protein